VILPAQATLEHSAELAAMLPESVAGGSGVMRIDASALQEFDTATIALLMQARRLAQAAGRSFEVHGAPAKLVQLAALYGVEELLSLSSAGSAPGVPRVETGVGVSA
jgi:phospholipid transport system transporter-binding protein